MCVHMLMSDGCMSACRQMAEKEEEFRKKEEERKRKEEEEEKEKDRKLRLANERLREERPKFLQELLQMDLDNCSIKSIKTIMDKMHVSHRGCLNRADLKERLLENVPELRLGQNSQPRTRNSNSGASGELPISWYVNYSHIPCHADDGCDPLGAVTIDKMESLRKELDQTKQKLSRAQASLQDKDFALREKDSIITGLRREKEELRLRSRSNSGTSMVSQEFLSIVV